MDNMNNPKDMGSPNRDILMGKWKQLRGRVREQWGKLTDSQIDQIGGNYDRLVGLLQENYGYTRQMAMEETDRWLENMDRGGRDSMGNP